MRPLCAALLALGLVFSRVSTAREFDLDVAVEAGYDSNVFRRSNEVSDLTYRLVPRMRLGDAEPSLAYEVRYTPTFIGYLEQTDANVWNHFAQAALTRYFDERTWLRVGDRFSRASTPIPDDPVGPGDVEFDVGLSPRTSNEVDLNLHRTLTQRTSVDAVLTHDIKRYDEDVYADWDYLSSSITFSRSLSARDSLGLGGLVGYRSFGDRGSSLSLRTSSRTRYLHFFLSLQHDFDERFTVSLRGGPTWLNVRQWSFPPAPLVPQTRTSQDKFTWFGWADIAKHWRTLGISLSYLRREAAIGGFGRSSIEDTLDLVGSWKPNDVWSVRLRGAWSRRTSKNQRLAARERNTAWYVSVLLARRLTSKSSLRVACDYRKQESDIVSGAGGYGQYSVRLGFRYDLSPVRF